MDTAGFLRDKIPVSALLIEKTSASASLTRKNEVFAFLDVIETGPDYSVRAVASGLSVSTATFTVPSSLQGDLSNASSSELPLLTESTFTAALVSSSGIACELNTGGSAAFWTPANLSSLAAWYDASDISTINKDGSNYVSQWDDKSGNDNHLLQSTGTDQPLYDSSNNLINFSGTYMSCSSFSPSGDYSFYFVVKNKETSISGEAHAIIGTKKNTGNGFLIYNINTWHTGSDIKLFLEGGGTTGTLYNDGSSILNNYSADELFQGALIGNLSSGPYSFRVNIIQNLNWRGNNDFCEIIVVNEQNTESQRQVIEGYLAHKWGIESKLPVDHPYKTNPPNV